MRKVLICLFAIMPFFMAYGQNKGKKKNKELQIPMEPAYWEHKPDQVEFITHRSVAAVQGKEGNGYQIFLKDTDFANGTIEYDVEIKGRGFPGIGFRNSKDKLNGELFYLRYFGSTSAISRNTLQYATIIDGVNMWDMTDDYQAAATIYESGWNHVKLVVSGKQMKVYVNDMQKPAMHVPSLEGTINRGGISLSGNVIYANFVIKPDATENLPATEGHDPTYSDSHYLRNWLITQPVDFPFGRDVMIGNSNNTGVAIDSTLLDSTAIWTPITAEKRAMVNFTRPFGQTKRGERRLVWVKKNISSETAQIRRIDLGFSDEVWVFINGGPLFIDKNYYGTPGMKEPRGRCTIGNSSFALPLKEGENELLIGVTNFFFGWGMIARLDETAGLKFD